MTAIADQSTMPAWPAWVWMIVAVAGLITIFRLILGLCAAASHEMPAPDEYEASPYGPVRKFRTDRMCELRGHQYGISEDGAHWVCVRGDDRVPVDADVDEVERYANGGAA